MGIDYELVADHKEETGCRRGQGRQKDRHDIKLEWRPGVGGYDGGRRWERTGGGKKVF